MKIFLSLAACLACLSIQAQTIYFPDSIWQTMKADDLQMNQSIIDSAVRFALSNEVKIDYDMRIANIKSYTNEPDYKILGPMKQRGKPGTGNKL